MSEVATRSNSDVVVGSEPASLIEIISRVAADPNCDVDKMERLLQMQERLVAREAEVAFNEAMQAAQAEMPQVLRDKKNDQTNSHYARLETIDKTIKPIIARHGFSLSFGTADSPREGHYRVTCIVSHIGGHSRNYHADLPADNAGIKGSVNKTPTHAFGSSMSYGRRYLKLLIFDLATTEDDDGNGAGGAIDPHEEAKPILDMIDATPRDQLSPLKQRCSDEAKARGISDNAFKLVRAHYSARLKREKELADA